MLICLQTRQGVIHSINYSSSKRYYTHCDDTFLTVDILSIFALDNVIPGMCKNCRSMVLYDLKFNSQTKIMINRPTTSMIALYRDIIAEYTNTENRYSSLADRRWAKLNRYKRISAR